MTARRAAARPRLARRVGRLPRRTAGLQDVLDAAGASCAHADGGLLCIYGESAGAQLALVAAERLRASTASSRSARRPTSRPTSTEAATSHDARPQDHRQPDRAVWGSTLEALAPWNPV